MLNLSSLLSPRWGLAALLAASWMSRTVEAQACTAVVETSSADLIPATGDGATATGAISCTTDLLGYTGTNGDAACATGAWTIGAGCTIKQCGQTSDTLGHDSKWGATPTNIGATEAIACSAYDAVKYAGDSNNVNNVCAWDVAQGKLTWATAIDTSPCATMATACAAEGTWTAVADTSSDEFSTLDCQTHNAIYATGASAKRTCLNLGLLESAIDESACVLTDATSCKADSLFAATATGQTVTVACTAFDPITYASGNASRTCTSGVWSRTDTSSCVKNTCAASGVWPETDVGETAYVFCSENDWDTKNWLQGMASRPCEVPSPLEAQMILNVPAWGTIDTTRCDTSAYGNCPELVEPLITYPNTAPGVTTTINCASLSSATHAYANTQEVTRACSATGAWATDPITTQKSLATICRDCGAMGAFTTALAHSGSDTMLCSEYATAIGNTGAATVHAGTTDVVTRTCANGVTSYAGDCGGGTVAACAAVKADSSALFNVAAGFTYSTSCNNYDPNLYADDGELVYIECKLASGNGSAALEPVDVTACNKLQCAAGEGFPATDAGVTATITCQEFAAAWAVTNSNGGGSTVKTGADATRACGNGGSWAAADFSACKCAATADGVWPEMPMAAAADGAGQVAVLCHKYKTQYTLNDKTASRECLKHGWDDAVDVSTSGCVAAGTCNAAGVFGTLLQGESVAVECTNDSAGTPALSHATGSYDGPAGAYAYATCYANGVAPIIDYSACNIRSCPSDGVWPQTLFSTTGNSEYKSTASLSCSDINAIYAGGVATRVCSGGTAAAPAWAAASLAGCTTYVTCPAVSSYSLAATAANTHTAIGTSALTCDAFNSVYGATEKVAWGCPPGDKQLDRDMYYDIDACVYDGCAASGSLTATSTAGEVTSSIDCAVKNAAWHGTQGTMTCDPLGATTYTEDWSGCGCNTAITVDGVASTATKLTTETLVVTGGCTSWTGSNTTPSGGDITLTCTSGVWSVTANACTWAQCSAGTANGIDWAAANHNAAGAAATGDISCGTYRDDSNNQIFKTGANVSRACVQGQWQAIVTSACSYLDCAATGAWPATADNAIAAVECAKVDGEKWQAGFASRACHDGAWHTVIDVDFCVPKPGVHVCRSVYGLDQKFSGETDTTDCSNYSAEWQSGASITGTCGTNDRWTFDTSACQLKQCAVDSSWGATDIGGTATLACNSYNSAYATGSNAIRHCTLSNTGVATWQNVDVYDCDYPDCAAATPWPATPSGQSATLKCSEISADYTDSALETVTRHCTDGAWEMYNFDLCTFVATKTGCNTSGPFLGGAGTFTRTVNCATVDPLLYSAGTASRACAAIGWGEIDLSSCVAKQCAAGDDANSYSWSATDAGTSASVKCHTYDPVKYADDDNVATRACAAGSTATWGSTSVASCTAAVCYAKEESYASATVTGDIEWYSNAGVYSVDCQTWHAGFGTGQVATRTCTNGVLSLWVDTTTACVSGDTGTDCAAGDAGGVKWPATPNGVTVRLPCNPSTAGYQITGHDATTNIYEIDQGYASRTCGGGQTWGAADESHCVKRSCAANGDWPITGYGQTHTMNCVDLYDGTKLYSAGTATRTCGTTATGGSIVWGSPDLTGCTKRTCAADGVWPETDADATATVDCGIADPRYATGANNAQRVCTGVAGANPTWGAEDYATNCGCYQKAKFTAVADSATSTWASCVEFDASAYANGGAALDVTLACNGATWGTAASHFLPVIDLAGGAANCDAAAGLTQCAAAGDIEVAGYDGRTTVMPCATVDSALWKSGNAYAVCHGTTWGDIDTSECVAVDCTGGTNVPVGYSLQAACANGSGYKYTGCGLEGTGWDTTVTYHCTTSIGMSNCQAEAYWDYSDDNAVESKNCVLHSYMYTSGTVARVCEHTTTDSVGAWGSKNFVGCTAKSCSANSNFPTTAAGQSATITCNTYNNAYKADAAQTATRTCSMAPDYSFSWGPVDVSLCVWDDCTNGDATWVATADGLATNSGVASADGAAADKVAYGGQLKKVCTGIDASLTNNFKTKTCGAGKTYSAEDDSACLTELTSANYCPADDYFAFTLVSASPAPAVDCDDINPWKWTDATNVARACVAGKWTAFATSTSGCTALQCGATGNYGAANVGATDNTETCNGYDNALYSSTSAKVVRACVEQTFTVAGGWEAVSDVDVSACTDYVDCTDANYGTVASGASSSATVTCDTAAGNSIFASGNMGARACANAAWGAEDFSACVFAKCADNLGFTTSATQNYAAAADTTLTADCNAYNSEYTAGQNASRKCLAGSETVARVYSSIVDTSACVITTAANQCAAVGDWPLVATTVTAHIKCSTYSDWFADDERQTASRLCTAGVWGVPNISSCVLKTCAQDATHSVITWAATAVGTSQRGTCTDYDEATNIYEGGEVVRTCDLVGGVATWSTVDVSACVPADCPNDALWGNDVDQGTTVSLACSYVDLRYQDDGEVVTRECLTGATWDMADFSACNPVAGEAVCMRDNDKQQTFQGDFYRVSCTTYDPNSYTAASEEATAFCQADGSFGAWDETGCATKKTCLVDYPWKSVAVGAFAKVWCPDVDATNYESGICMRECLPSALATDANGLWEDWAAKTDTNAGQGADGVDAPVLASGVTICAAVSPWPATIVGKLVTIPCATYDADMYDAGTATKSCTGVNTFATTVDVTGCVLRRCPMTGNFMSAEIGATSTYPCNLHDALYAAGASVTRTCAKTTGGAPAFGAEDISACRCSSTGWPDAAPDAYSKRQCNDYNTKYMVDYNYAYMKCTTAEWDVTIDEDDCVFDKTHKMCYNDPIWPDTMSSTTPATLYCHSHDSDMYSTDTTKSATRLCTDGAWEAAVTTACTNILQCASDTALANSSGGSVTWAATNVGADASLQCEVYDSVLWKLADPVETVTRGCTSVAGTATWDAAVVDTACAEAADCPAHTLDGVAWPTVADGVLSKVTCDTYKTGYLVGTTQEATRACANGVLGAVDDSACTELPFGDPAMCSADGVWPKTFGAATASVYCSVYDDMYAVDTSKSATRACTDGTWGTVVTTACDTKVTCSAHAGFLLSDVGVVAETDCSAYNSDFKTGATTEATRECFNAAGVAVWAIPDASACICKADGDWAETEVGETATATCDNVNSNYDTAVSATRPCLETGWGAIDSTACTPAATKYLCAATGAWPETWSAPAPGTTVTVNCVDIDTQYASGTATNTCTDGTTGSVGTWGTAVLTGCVLKQCAALDGFSAADVGASPDPELLCSTYDSAIYGIDATKKATRSCALDGGVATWGDVDVSACTVYTDCAATRDGVWSLTSSAAAASETPACDAYSAGFSTGGTVTKTCTNGVWEHDDVAGCTLATDFQLCPEEDSGGFPAEFGGNLAEADCAAVDPELYTAGEARKFCDHTGTWATNVLDGGCTFKQCPAVVSQGLSATDVLSSSTVACATYDSTKWQSGNAVATCTNVSGVPTWSVDETACVWVDCAQADLAVDGMYTWELTVDGATASAYCARYDSAHYKPGAEVATRACINSIWSATIDESACVVADGVAECIDSDVAWPRTFAGEQASLACEIYDAATWKSGTATVACTAGTFGTVDTSGCVPVDCVADGIWPATAHGASASVTCDVYDSDFYSDTKSVTRACSNSVWADPVVDCDLKAGVFECAASDGYSAAYTGQIESQDCSGLTGDYAGMYESGTAYATCTNNSGATAASFSDHDVSGCVAFTCLEADSPNGVFPTTDVKSTASLDCKLYDTNLIGEQATVACLLADDGTAVWSDEVDVSQCEGAAADSSSQLCSIGAGIVSAACVAAAAAAL